jgi:hypothetical protein
MSHRFLASLFEGPFAPRRALALGTVAVVVGVGSLAPAPVEGQTRAAGANAKETAATSTWTPPLTPYGQPDLQGVWWNNSATPLERPKQLEGRQFLTDEEVSELKKRAARLFDVNSNADFAGGDNYFQALLANPDRYQNPNATGSVTVMVEREVENRTSLIVDPADGKIPPFTTDGQKRNARYPAPNSVGSHPPGGAEDLSNALRCITYGVPRVGTANLNGAGPLGYYQILQAPGYVVVFLETIHETRIIPLDGRPHLADGVRQWGGDSRGRWEGNTLVVDTTNFSPHSNFMGAAENLHVVERFTRVAADTINYEITLNDQTTWTKPWTAVIRLKRTDDKIYEYACHEGNFYTMEGILGAARADEKAAEKAHEGPK